MNLVGTVFTQNQFRILIGQKFSSTISFDPGSPTSASDTYSWTLSAGKPFADYTAPPSTGPAVYTPFTTPTGDSLNCYFAKPEAVACQCVVTLANAGGLQVTLSRSFATRAPSFDFRYEIAGSNAVIMPDGAMRFYGSTYLREDGGFVTSGIIFHDKVTTPSPWSAVGAGSWCWTQLVTSITMWKKIGVIFYDWAQNFTTGPAKLVNTHPYGSVFFSGDGFEGELNDSPKILDNSALQLYYKAYFKTHQLYKPPGADSRFVPLRAITWNWRGHAWRNSIALPWAIDENAKGSTVLGDFLAHPVWNETIFNNGTWVPR
jgi:hypothetical protein